MTSRRSGAQKRVRTRKIPKVCVFFSTTLPPLPAPSTPSESHADTMSVIVPLGTIDPTLYLQNRQKAISWLEANSLVAPVEITVYWGDMDANSHVSNVRYFNWLENGRIGVLKHFDGPKAANGKGALSPPLIMIQAYGDGYSRDRVHSRQSREYVCQAGFRSGSSHARSYYRFDRPQ